MKAMYWYQIWLGWFRALQGLFIEKRWASVNGPRLQDSIAVRYERPGFESWQGQDFGGNRQPNLRKSLIELNCYW